MSDNNKSTNGNDDEDDDDSSSASSDCSFFDAPRKAVVTKKKAVRTRMATKIATQRAKRTGKGNAKGKAEVNQNSKSRDKKDGNRARATTTGSSSEEEVENQGKYHAKKDESKSESKKNAMSNSIVINSDSSSNSDQDSSDSDSDDAFNFTRQKFGKGNIRKGSLSAVSRKKSAALSSLPPATAETSLGGKRQYHDTNKPSSSPSSPLTKKSKGNNDNIGIHVDDSDESDNDDDDDNNEVSKKLALFSKKQEEQSQKKRNSIVLVDSDDEDDIFAATSGVATSTTTTAPTRTGASTKKAANDKSTASAGKTATLQKSSTSISVHNTRQSSNEKKGKSEIDPNKDSFTNAISLLDSDDDEDNTKYSNGGNAYNSNNSSHQFSASVNALLQRAKRADMELNKVRVAGLTLDIDDDDNDINDGEIEVELVPTRTPYSYRYPSSRIKPSNTTKSSSSKQPQQQQAMGPSITINLRTNVQSAPKSFDKKSMHDKSNMVRFRTGTKVQKLFDKYYTFYPIAKYSTVKFTFDGLVMDVNKMISNYDLEDEDLVDVLVTIPRGAELKVKNEIKAQNPSERLHVGTKNGGGTNTSTAVTYVKINTRIKDGDPEKTHIYQLKSIDPFDKLIKAYRDEHGYSSFKIIVLKYNDIPIDGAQSPSDLGLVDGCLVEICDETERAKQVNRMLAKSSKHMDGGASSSNTTGDFAHPLSSSSGGVTPPGGVTIKVRINGDDKSILSYGIMLNAPFETIMKKVYEKNKVTEKECKFEFDGQKLNPKTTPRDEDLESDETIVIEAKIDKSALEEERIEETLSTSKVATRSTTIPKTTISTSKASQPPKPIPINVLTLRNNVSSAKTKKFRLPNDSVIQKLKTAYVKYYRKKGCSSVTFYHNSVPIKDLKQTFASLGVNDMSLLIAMENGRKL